MSRRLGSIIRVILVSIGLVGFYRGLGMPEGKGQGGAFLVMRHYPETKVYLLTAKDCAHSASAIADSSANTFYLLDRKNIAMGQCIQVFSNLGASNDE